MTWNIGGYARFLETRDDNFQFYCREKCMFACLSKRLDWHGANLDEIVSMKCLECSAICHDDDKSFTLIFMPRFDPVSVYILASAIAK